MVALPTDPDAAARAAAEAERAVAASRARWPAVRAIARELQQDRDTFAEKIAESYRRRTP